MPFLPLSVSYRLEGCNVKALSQIEVIPRRWLVRAVALSVGAGVIHLLMTPIFFQQWLGYGVFFVTVAFAQITGAAAYAVMPTSRFLLWAGIVANSAIIALWLVTRTLGVPFVGPEAGQVLPAGVPDLLSVVIELALIGHLVVLLRYVPQLEARPLVE